MATIAKSSVGLASRLTKDVNTILMERGILHATLLERLKQSEVNAVMSFLNNEVLPDLNTTVQSRLARIRSRGFDRGPWTTRQYKEMNKTVQGMIRGGMSQAGVRLQGQLSKVGVYEANFQSALLRDTLPSGVLVDITTPSITTLNSIVTSRPFQGQLLKGWFSNLGESLQRSVTSQINIGLATGEPTAKIVRRLMGTAGAAFKDGAYAVARRQAEAVTRTAVNHIVTQAREATYQNNKSVVKGVRYLATLDSRTTDICASLDGEVFNMDEGPRPPMHHQCRSTTVPVIKSWKEMGIDMKEAPAGMRSSMNGLVPEKTTYGKWLKGQSKNVQNEVLGKGRAKLFRRGTVPIQRFVDNKFRPLTLKQLEALEQAKLKTGKFPRRTKVTKKATRKVGKKTPLRKKTTKKVTKTTETVKKGAKKVSQKVLQRAAVESSKGQMTGQQLRDHLLDKFGRKYDKAIGPLDNAVVAAEKAYDDALALWNKQCDAFNALARSKKWQEMSIPARRAAWAEIDAKKAIKDTFLKSWEKSIKVRAKGLVSFNKELHRAMAIEGEGFTVGTRYVAEKGTSYTGKTARRKGRGGKQKVGMKALEPKHVTKISDDALDWMRQTTTSEASFADFELFQQAGGKGARAYASLGKQRSARFQWRKGATQAVKYETSGNSVVLSTADDVGVAIHEQAHLLEGMNARWRKEIHDFLQTRILQDIEAKIANGTLPNPGTRGVKGMFEDLAKKAVSSEGYVAREGGWHDKFFNKYIGRRYGKAITPGTEVTSMGMEHMWRDPIKFARADPEMFELIANLQRGGYDDIAKMSFKAKVPRPEWADIRPIMQERGW